MKTKAFGLNRMDLLQREGHYPVPPQAGKILGVEFSGTIEALGPDVKENFKVGDEVFGLACQLINSLCIVFPHRCFRWWSLCRIRCRFKSHVDTQA